MRPKDREVRTLDEGNRREERDDKERPWRISKEEKESTEEMGRAGGGHGTAHSGTKHNRINNTKEGISGQKNHKL